MAQVTNLNEFKNKKDGLSQKIEPKNISASSSNVNNTASVPSTSSDSKNVAEVEDNSVDSSFESQIEEDEGYGGGELEKEKIISNIERVFMVALAIILDLLSIIPVVSDVVDIIATCIFGFWFYRKGASFSRSKKMLGAAIISIIIEAIPAVSILPMITIDVILNIGWTEKDQQPSSKEGEESSEISGKSGKPSKAGTQPKAANLKKVA